MKSEMKLTLKQKIERREKTNRTAAASYTEPVASIEELAALARTKRSVYHQGAWGLLPASVVMNMSALCVYNAIKSGKLFWKGSS